MRRKRLIWLVALTLIAVGVGLWLVSQFGTPDLETADRVTLLSVDGRDRPFNAPPPAGETAHGYPVLGRVEITDPGQRRALATALRDGIAARDVVSQFKCFWPRHILRIEKSGRVTDYVICFHCQNYERFVDGRRVDRYTWPFSRHVRPAFDEPLIAAGVPIIPDLIPD